MATYVNKVLLQGQVEREPQTRRFDSGKLKTTLRVKTAVELPTGKTYSDYHTVTCWGNLAEQCQALPKGAWVRAQGRISTRMYEKNGQKRFFTEVSASKIDPLDVIEDNLEEDPFA